MFTLSTGQIIEAASSTTNISYIVSKIDTGIVAEGFFYTKKTMHTAGSPSSLSLLFANTNQNSDTTLRVWIEGSLVFKGVLVSGGSVSFDGQWKVYNADGIQMLDSGFERITVSAVAPSNPSIGDLWIQI